MFNDIKFGIKLFIYLIVLDLLWVSFVISKPFGAMISNIQGSEMVISLPGAIISYTILFFYLFLFLRKTNSDTEAFLMGFLTYGIYDSTNFATLKNWQPSVALVDSLWGGCLFFLLRRLTVD